MKIRIKNLGILRQAEFSLGDLTIICGENNTGKTYMAYALYDFLQSWRNLIRVPVSDAQIQHLIKDGVLNIGLAQYVKKADEMLAEACNEYKDKLDDVFAAPEGTFDNSEFQIQVKIPDGIAKREITGNTPFITFLKREGSEELVVTLEKEKEQKNGNFFLQGIQKAAYIETFMGLIISSAIFRDSFPRPFIASAERTGLAIFRKELNFARNRLLDEIAQADKKIDPRPLLSKEYQNYPSPIEANVEFTRQLEEIKKRKSFITKEHPEVLEDFADIMGGNYSLPQNDQLYYQPKGTRVRLTMVESSSAVRSLLDLGFYLRHVAQKGDLLMVDEPELNLHPANQRRIAKLFARLVNVGVKVFITTHSDYIVKELNTLIMLNGDKPHLKKIAEENGYRDAELLRVDQVEVYTAREALMPLEEGQKRRRRGHTLVAAEIDPELGIAAPSFDETINDMNRIQEDIIWGAE